jgi:hypothetical protein
VGVGVAVGDGAGGGGAPPPPPPPPEGGATTGDEMLKASVIDALAPRSSVTVTSELNAPATGGIPVIVALEDPGVKFKLMPVGRALATHVE